MLNDTMLSVGTAISTTTSNSWTFLSGPFFERIISILVAPYSVPEMLWMLLPLLGTLILMEFYFGRYKEEELGWNTAVGNSLVLMFVAIDLFRHVYDGKGITNNIFSGDVKIIISIIIFALGGMLMLIDFFHILPKKAAYIVSSPAIVNLIGLLGIIIVYSQNIPLDWTTLAACVVIFALANFIAHICYWIIPSYTSPLQRILTVDDVEKFGKNKEK